MSERDSTVRPHCLRYGELPTISLYMDQVLLVIGEALASLPSTDTDVITSTMINNYVKMKLIRPSTKKKYEREQIAQLVMITALKRVLSMSEIALVLKASEEYESFGGYYDRFCEELEAALCGNPDPDITQCTPTTPSALLSAAVKVLADKLAFEELCGV